MVQFRIPSNNSFAVLIDDGGLDEAIKEVPFSMAFASLRMFRRVLFQYEKELAETQKQKSAAKSDPFTKGGMKRFVKKFLFVKSNPLPSSKGKGGGGLLATTRRFLKGSGKLGDISADIASFGPVFEAHEKGATITGKQVVMSPKGRRGLSKILGKSSMRKNVTSNMLNAIAIKTRGLKSGAKGSLITFTGKDGQRHWFIVKAEAKGNQKAKLERIASEVDKVVIPPSIGARKYWDSNINRLIGRHQTGALVEIEQGLKRKQKSKRWKT